MPCGSPLFGANAIIRAICRATPLATCCQLYGRTSCEHARVDQWLDFCEEKVDANVQEILSQLGPDAKYNPRNYDMALKNVKEVCNKLNTIMAPRTFIVGERCTMADISLAVSLAPMFSTVLGEAERKHLINITRWISTIMGLCPVKAVCGDLVLAAEAVAPKKPEKQKKPEKKAEKKEEKE